MSVQLPKLPPRSNVVMVANGFSSSLPIVLFNVCLMTKCDLQIFSPYWVFPGVNAFGDDVTQVGKSTFVFLPWAFKRPVWTGKSLASIPQFLFLFNLDSSLFHFWIFFSFSRKTYGEICPLPLSSSISLSIRAFRRNNICSICTVLFPKGSP